MSNRKPKEVIINKPIDWSGTFKFSEQVTAFKFPVDDEGHTLIIPVLPVDIGEATTLPNSAVAARAAVSLSDPINMGQRQEVVIFTKYSTVPYLTQGRDAMIIPQVVAGDTGFEPQRTPVQFKGAIATAAGDTALWTPTAGKKFRLMGGCFSVSKDAACAGQQIVVLKDAATNTTIGLNISGAVLVATGQVIVYPFKIPANGFLSAAANNVLNINLNGAFTAGSVYVHVWGTEE